MQAPSTHAVVADRFARQVLGDRDAAAVLGACIEQRREQRAVRLLGAEHRVDEQVLQRPAERLAPLMPVELERGIGRQVDRRHDRHRQTREPPHGQFALHPAKPRELQAVDADGKHFRARLVGDDARAFVHLHQRAGVREAAFGEDHQLAAVIAHRLDHVLHRIGRLHIDLEDVDGGEERPRPPLSRHARMHREGRALRQITGDQARIGEREMVRDDDDAIARGAVVLESRSR